jgi:hypothetical protein
LLEFHVVDVDEDGVSDVISLWDHITTSVAGLFGSHAVIDACSVVVT